MIDPVQPPPQRDGEHKNKTFSSIFEKRTFGNNAWTGLVIGSLLQSPGVVVMMIDPLGGFFIYLGLASLVFVAAIVVLLVGKRHVGLGLLLSVGVCFVLLVGGCMLGVVPRPTSMH